MSIEIIPILGIGRVRENDDVAEVLIEAIGNDGVVENDVVVVTHKIISKSEGAVVKVNMDEELERIRLVESEAVSIIRRRGDLIIAETKHGFICANAGVDRSNAEPGTMIRLPDDPDKSAHRIRTRLEHHFDVPIGVIISDTFGRPFRVGVADVAIGVSGIDAVIDLKGTKDWLGRELEVTEIAVADELASAADLAMGKSEGIPAAIVRGWTGGVGSGRGSDLVRPVGEDLFR
jgi:coenzyme F420-0:L-glutamate ligase/coenzyme F420-1:gamma-L-glutamate ligase